MSHKAQMDYVLQVREKHPDIFVNKKVLEIGSLNINGTVRPLFYNCQYLGIDIGPGKDVDYVGHFCEMPRCKYDVIISCEALEHDARWQETLRLAVESLRPGGWLIVTCGGEGRPEHGTASTTPLNSPHTLDWYQNLTEADIRESLVSYAEMIELEFDLIPEDTRFTCQKK